MKRKQVPVGKRRSIKDFVRAKKCVGCVVCSLPPSVKAQIRGRHRKALRVTTIIEWLEAEWNLKVTMADWNKHWYGRHDPGGVASR